MTELGREEESLPSEMLKGSARKRAKSIANEVTEAVYVAI